MQDSSDLLSFCFQAPAPIFHFKHFSPKFAATAHINGNERLGQIKNFSVGYKGQKTAELNSLIDTCKGGHKIFGNVPKMLGNGPLHRYQVFYHLGTILNSVCKLTVAQWFSVRKVSY